MVGSRFVFRARRMKRLVSPLTLIVLVGALLRLWFLFASQWMVEGDEAAVGLQALHLLRGEWTIFYPGQTYLGNFESYLTAAVFAVSGPSRYALKVVPFVFSLLFIALSYELGNVVFNDKRAGLLAALFAALAPIYLTMWSLKARGGYIEALVYAQLAWLWLHRAVYPADNVSPRRMALGAGVVIGYGLWMNPITLYLFGPLALVYGGILLARLARGATWRAAASVIGLGIVGAVLSLLPLLLHKLAYGGATLAVTADMAPVGSQADIVAQIWQYLWHDGLPTVIGLRAPKSGPFTLDWRVIAVPVYALALLALAPRARRSAGDAVLLLMTLAAFPIFAYGSMTRGNFAVIIPDSGLLTRYLVPLGLLFALAAARLLGRIRPALAAAGCAVLIAVNLASAAAVDPVALARNEFANQPLPASYDDVIAALREQGTTRVYTNHWIGYLLTLESREAILTYDYNDTQFQMDRFPDYSRAVLAAPNTALVVFNPHYEPNPIDAQLRQMGVSYQKRELPSFIIYFDMQPPIKPAALDRVLQWPYY